MLSGRLGPEVQPLFFINHFSEQKKGTSSVNLFLIKSQLAIAFFAAVNHLNGPLGKQNFTLTGSKGHDL